MQSSTDNSKYGSSVNIMNNKSLLAKYSISNTDAAAYTTIFVSVVLGFWFRIQGLGTYPLAVDEYYIVKSVENILKFGVPQFEAGGFYIRGIIYQYITAGFLLLGIKAEFAARLFPLLANFLTIPPLYILAKKVSGKLFASVLVAVFCFSIWEIEMARFARMYSSFQAVFMFYLLCMYEYIVENNESRKKWIYILSFISVFTHEASIFVAAFNFVPIIWNKKVKVTDIILGLAIVVFAYLFLTFDFRTYNNQPILPTDVTVPLPGGGKFYMPDLMIFYLAGNAVWIVLFSIPVLFSMYVIWGSLTKSDLPLITKLSVSLLIILSIFNLFGLMAFIAVIMLVLNWLNIKLIKENIVRLALLVIILNLVFWTVYLITNTGWTGNPGNIGQLKLIKEIVKVLFKYPNFDILTVYLHAIPLFSIMAGILLTYSLVKIFRDREPAPERKRFLFFTILSFMFLVTLVNTFYNETRYTFFLFPVILLLILSAIESATNDIFSKRYSWKVLYIVPVIIFLVPSEDFDLHHAVNVDSKEINYRIGFNRPKAYHYYLRWDVKSPADIINKEASKDDIVITNNPVTDYYLKKLDYVYNDFRGKNFKNATVFYGTKERWSNKKLIYRNTDLEKIINERKSTTWVIVDDNKYLKEISFREKHKQNLYYKTFEGKLNLYKFPAINVYNQNKNVLTKANK